ncbi:hypothetical protein LCGC14_1702410, partial [marine sediment metagenome]
LTEDQRDDVCCRYQKLTQVFITQHWKELTEYQRDRVCISQKLTQPFISNHWKELTKYQRNYVCLYQELTTSFKKQLINGNISKVQGFIPTKTMRYIDMDFEEF